MRLHLGSLAFLLAAICSAQAVAAPVPIFEDGQLRGASNIEVGEALYNVEFIDGSCESIFGGCDELSDFSVDSSFDPMAASQALLTQLFVNSVVPGIDEHPYLTYGCSAVTSCAVLTPLGFQTHNGVTSVLLAVAGNVGTANGGYDEVDVTLQGIDRDFSIPNYGRDEVVFGKWSPVSQVPIPAAAWLFGSALAGLIGIRKRRDIAHG